MAGVRDPEPWESNAAGPFLTIDSPAGAVTVQSPEYGVSCDSPRAQRAFKEKLG
jgi:hypothetical protein